VCTSSHGVSDCAGAVAEVEAAVVSLAPATF